MATKTLNQDELLETIGNMSVFELAEFIEVFKEKFNVTIAAPVAAAAPAAGGGDAGGDSEEQTEFTAVLTEVGGKKIQVIKAVREVTSLGLKEAKDVVDSAPSNVKENVSKEEAESIKAKLEAQGATVELK
ncbi:MAG: 50S ribosomal protein L7/L12 [Gemmatimonadetes bacterium]|nr:50S ribosomal protein L7/L12 [Gemmatimonadota bacterium]